MAASTHPPFDPELSAVLAALPAELQQPMTIEDIPARREQLEQFLPADDDALRREGAVELEERQIPGPDGAADLSVLILRPARGPGGRGPGRALPGVYHIHGGGMVMGTNRTGADEMARWADEVGAVAGSALMARDRGGPALTYQILMCPMLDDRGITPSSQELDGEGVWDRTDNLVGYVRRALG